MKDTRVDDMIIEMITPKMEEIQKKFTSGVPLSPEDINTLLLKAQFNHVNHLDEKLTQVADSVVSLKSDFMLLETKFSHLEERLESKFENFENRVNAKIENLENSIDLKIEKTMNRQMLVMSAILGIFLTVSQILEFLQ